jgi:hypothetical protein
LAQQFKQPCMARVFWIMQVGHRGILSNYLELEGCCAIAAFKGRSKGHLWIILIVTAQMFCKMLRRGPAPPAGVY